MQRNPLPTNAKLLLMAGYLLKTLFVSMFICTVLVVLAGVFGAGDAALAIYQVIWSFFWRICVSLAAFIAILTMFEGL